MADDHWYPFSDKSEDEDTLLDRAYDRWEQMGGAAAARGPLFQFTMQPIGRRRRWCEVVERAQFNAQLRQLRDPVPGDNIGMALTEALRQAIETELDREQRPAHHFVNSAIMAHGFTHAYQIANFTVGEFLQRTARLDEMLATLASKLNSNKAFNPDRGFQVDVVFISMPGPGSGRHKKKLNPGRLCLDRDNKKKKCIITIRNRCGQPTMSIDQNLSRVSGPVHGGSRPTSQVRARQIPCVSGMGIHPGPQVLHSTRGGGGRGVRTNRGGGR